MLRLGNKGRWVLFYFLLFVIGFSAMVGFLLTVGSRYKVNPGVEAVKIMYNFEDLYDLESKYDKLYSILDESLWEDFQLANDSRMISVYFKFKNSKSSVEFVYISDSVVIYRIKNDYIGPNRIFVFSFETKHGKIVSISEYEMKGLRNKEVGVF